MRITVILTAIICLVSCSGKPELNQILESALGYSPVNPYVVISHSRSPSFLDIWGWYNESYEIELDQMDYQNLISVANTNWKIQPKVKNGRTSWERIHEINQFGVVSISSLNSESKFVYIHLSGQ